MTKLNAVILGIETCTNICSVALWDGEKMHERLTETARSHSKSLIPMIEALLEDANKSLHDVDYVACARGPGSFTGVRIGVAVAKGIAFGQGIPIIGISPLAALALQMIRAQPDSKAVTALLDARMGELYSGTYHNEQGYPQLIGEEQLLPADQWTAVASIIGGTGVDTYRQTLMEKGAVFSEVIYPLAADVVRLALAGSGEEKSAADFAPVYLRDKVTD